jgi:hypothetical protein
MNPVLDHLINSEFADLEGSRMEGQLVLTDTLVNAGLTNLLVQIMRPASPEKPAPASPPPSPVPTTGAPGLDVKKLLEKVTIDHIHYRTEHGRTILELKAAL